MAKKKQQAKKMAAAGKSAAQIKAKTGVGSASAQKYVAKAAPKPAQKSTPKPAQNNSSLRINSAGDTVSTTPTSPIPDRDPFNRPGGIDGYQVRFIPGAMLPGQVGYDAASGGGVWGAGPKSDEELRQYYRGAKGQDPSGYTLDSLYPQMATTSNEGTESTKKAKKAKKLKIKGVGQGLRISGGGGLSKGELKTISDVSGKDPGKIIGKLDKINEKLAGKDKTGITLRSGAANMLIKKASKSTPKSRGYKPVDFGSGAIGSALMGMMGDSGSPGTWIKGQKQGVREAVEPTFLAKGIDLGPGGKETVRGVGKQYKVPKRFTGDATVDDTVAGDTTANDTAVNTTAADTMAGGPVIPEEEPIDTSLSSGAGGLDLASWATGFRRARSARQRAGQGAQGLSSMKKDFKFKPWNT